MAIDTYKNTMGGLESPAREAMSVTPNDTVDLTHTSRAVYVGVSGDIAVHMADETTAVIFKSVPVGILPVRLDRILATGTSASDLVTLW
ncbi:MAG: hypothetical protein V3V13_05360 [Paracoccaceae bacterium]